MQLLFTLPSCHHITCILVTHQTHQSQCHANTSEVFCNFAIFKHSFRVGMSHAFGYFEHIAHYTIIHQNGNILIVKMYEDDHLIKELGVWNLLLLLECHACSSEQ